MSETVQVKLFTLHCALEVNPCTRFSPKPITHWALLIEYYDENNELDREEIVEGTRDYVVSKAKSDSILVCHLQSYGKKKKREFETDLGHERVPLQIDGGYHKIPDDNFASRFCGSFNKNPKPYHAIENSCQTVIKEFLATAGIETSLVPNTTKEVLSVG